jgi:8-oxo-dGTP pyrophosphatase MutT (NUDIX family)
VSAEVRHRISSGGVVVRRAGGLELCLINPRGRGSWALPKGWIEPGETPEAAALREVREETGLDGVIEDELGTIEYWFFSRDEGVRIHKTVHFFLMQYAGGDTADHDHEVTEARWLPVERALDVMTYPNEREIVRRAVAILDSRAGDTTG